MDGEITREVVLDIIDTVTELIGGEDSDIETAISNLIDVKTWAANQLSYLEQLEQEIEEKNNKIINLRRGNNELMRKVEAQQEIAKKITEDNDDLKEIRNYFM